MGDHVVTVVIPSGRGTDRGEYALAIRTTATPVTLATADRYEGIADTNVQ